MSALLPAPRVSSPGLVSLYHTLLIIAMTGPLSQRMPSSFCLLLFLEPRVRRELPQESPSRSWVGSLTRRPLKSQSSADYLLFASSEGREADLFVILFVLPTLGRGNFLKSCVSSLAFCSLRVTQTPRLVSTSLYPLSLLLSLATRPTLSHSCLLF